MAKRITTVNDVDPFDIANKFFIPLLTEAGYEVQYLITGRDNIRDSAREFDPHAIIINLPLGSLDAPSKNGGYIDICRAAPELTARPLIVCSHSLMRPEIGAYLTGRGCLLLPQPFTPAELLRVVQESVGSVQA
jgi:hypothetical protein